MDVSVSLGLVDWLAKAGPVGLLAAGLVFTAYLWLGERRERLQMQQLLLSITSAKIAEKDEPPSAPPTT